MAHMSSEEHDKETVVALRTRSLLDLTSDEARRFLLDPGSYCSIDLPKYFDFTQVLACAFEVVNLEEKCCRDSPKVGHLSGVNYLVLDNKDGAYGWRPMQLVHPILYVSLVSLITDPAHWQELQELFKKFQSAPKIRCQSIPLVEDGDPSKKANIRNWWISFEQESVRLSLDYKYIASTDITDCYGALYTHSVAWAIHGKDWAKKNRQKSYLGNGIDDLLQDMHNRQTNGIPQGNVVSDLIAEVVLGYADLEVSQRLQTQEITNFQILRYRDDYRIFTNSKEDARTILLVLTNVLSGLNFKLSSAKTRLSDDVIGASIKADKQFWNQNINSRRSAFKTLLLIRDVGMRFPNSGSLVKELGRFRRRIEAWSSKPNDNAVLISVVVDIMYHNPRVYPQAASILSKLLSFESASDVTSYLNRIRRKFTDIPNVGFLDVWMQRISWDYDLDCDYEEPLCQIATGKSGDLWNCDWLTDTAKEAIGNASIVSQTKLADIDRIITLEETELFTMRYDDDYKQEPIESGEIDDFGTPESEHLPWIA